MDNHANSVSVKDVNVTEDGSEVERRARERLKLLISEGTLAPVFHKNDGLPPWFDWHSFTRGQKFFQDNFFSMFVGKLCGLITILAVPSILRVLVLTRKSVTPQLAYKRYLGTIMHMLDWYSGDILDPQSRAHKSMMSVRGRHCAASDQAARSGLGAFSQYDMAITQFGFMGYLVIKKNQLGIKGSREDMEGLVHFWRTIGYMIGIDDRYNLCSSNSLEETEALFSLVEKEVVQPLLSKPSLDFLAMSQVLLEGVWALVPFIDADAFLQFTYRLAGLWSEKNNNTPPKFSKPSSIISRNISNFYSQVTLYHQIFVHEVVLRISILAWLIRPYLNFLTWFAVYISPRMPVLAYVAFGRKQVLSTT